MFYTFCKSKIFVTALSCGVLISGQALAYDVTSDETINSGNNPINSDVVISDGATLTVADSESINYKIDGANSEVGTLSIASGTLGNVNTFNVSENIGSSQSLLAINVGDYAILDSGTGNVIKASTITIGSGISGEIDLVNNSVIIGDVVVSDGATLSVSGSTTISNGNVKLIGSNSVLSLSGTSYYINTLQYGGGSSSTEVTHTTSSDLGYGGGGGITFIRVDDYTTLNVNHNIDVGSQILIGDGNSGTLNLAAGKTISAPGNVVLNSGAELIVNDGSQISGLIVGNSAGVGTLSLAAGTSDSNINSFTLSGNGGDKLAKVQVGDYATFNVAGSAAIRAVDIIVGDGVSGTLNIANSGEVYSSNSGDNGVTLNEGAKLIIGSTSSFFAAVNGSAAGVGNVQIADGASLTLYSNADLGLNNKLNTVDVGSGTTLMAYSDLKAVNLNLDTNSTFTNQSAVVDVTDFTIENGAKFISQVSTVDVTNLNLKSGAEFDAQSGSTVTIGSLQINDDNYTIAITDGSSVAADTIELMGNSSTPNSFNVSDVTSLASTVSASAYKINQYAELVIDSNVDYDDENLVITNEGTITSTNSYDAISSHATSSTTVTNSGIITGDINFYDDSDSTRVATLNQYGGTITGDVDFHNTVGSLVWGRSSDANSGNSGVISGTISGTNTTITTQNTGSGGITTDSNIDVKSLIISADDIFTVGNSNTVNISDNIKIGDNAELVINIGSTVSADSIQLNSDDHIITNNGSFTADTIELLGGTSNSINTFNSTTATDLNPILTTAASTFKVNQYAELLLNGDVTVDTVQNSGGTISFGTTNRTITGDVTSDNSSSVFDLSSASHIIDGNFTTVAGNSLKTTLQIGGNSIGNLTVTGAATINSDNKFYLSIDSITKVGTYTIVDGGTGSSIGSINSSNIYINDSNTNKQGKYKLSLVASGDDLLLKIAKISSGSNPNEINVINNLDLISSKTGALSAVSNAIDNETATASTLLPQTNTVGNDANSSIIIGNVGNINSVVTSRSSDVATMMLASTNSAETSGVNVQSLDGSSKAKSISNSRSKSGAKVRNYGKRNKSPAAGDETLQKGLWSKLFGNSAHQGTTSAGGSSSVKGYGFVIGGDKKIDSNTYLGLSFGYGQSKTTSDGKRTISDSYQLNAYGIKSLTNKLYLDGTVGVAYSRNQSSRSIEAAGVIARASYGVQTYSSRVGLNYDQHLTDDKKLLLTPVFAVTAASTSVDKYSERGADTANLTVKTKSSQFFEARLGTTLSYNTEYKDYKLTPKLNASYGYDFLGQKQTTNSNFAGQATSFRSQGANVVKGSAVYGVALDVAKNDITKVTLDYTHQYRQHLSGDTGSVNFSYKF